MNIAASFPPSTSQGSNLKKVRCCSLPVNRVLISQRHST